MWKLFQLGISFLKHSKMLTFSAFFSIFIACFLGVGLFQLSSNIDNSIQSAVTEKMQQYKNSELYSSVLEEEAAGYQGIHQFLKILYGLILGISSLFILSIFHEFIKKYVREMAIIRTFGGTIGQVNLIFLFMSVVVSFFACLTAGMTSAIVDTVLLNYLNQKYEFFRGKMMMDWQIFFGMIFLTFLILNILLMIFFAFSQYGLPMQIFHQTETGLRRNKDGLRFLFLKKIMGKNGYLAWKLLLPKWKQNLFIIFLIICMTAFSYVGESFMNMLSLNSYAYYEDLLKGADGHCELTVDSSASTIEAEKVNQIRKQWKKEQIECSYIHGVYEGQMGSAWGFYTTDLFDFTKRFVKDTYQSISSVPLEQQMVIGKMLAEQEGYHLGDRVRLKSKYLKEEKEFTLVGIFDWSPYSLQKEFQILVDKVNYTNLHEKEENPGNGNSLSLYFYGNRDTIQDIFTALKQEGWIFTGYISEKILRNTEKQIKQMNIISKIVVWGLILVIATGWLNSVRGMLLSRKQDYHVLRLIGTEQKRVQKICFLQINLYLLTGIISGTLLGFILAKELWEKELYYGVKLHIQFRNTLGIFLLFWLVSLLLHKTVREVSK
jgi:ABC-type lipoprotein release transport system permease subunit